MRVYLMRHATAEESGPSGDASRRLTDQGQREARKAGEALRDAQATISRIVASPRTRAKETAEIVAAVLGLKATVSEGLNSGASITAYRVEFQDEVLIVGHNPEIGSIASSLAGQTIGFRPSTIVLIDDDRLIWMRHPAPE